MLHYQAKFKDYYNRQVVLDIKEVGEGVYDPIKEITIKSLKIEAGDDYYTPIANGKLSARVVSSEFGELHKIFNLDATVYKLYSIDATVDGTKIFTGLIDTQLYRESFVDELTIIDFKATNGLGLLNNYKFGGEGQPPIPSNWQHGEKILLKDFVQSCLIRTKFKHKVGFRIGLVDNTFNSSHLSMTSPWSSTYFEPRNYVNNDGEMEPIYKILEDLLTAYKCRLMLDRWNGELIWKIERYVDLDNGVPLDVYYANGSSTHNLDTSSREDLSIRVDGSDECFWVDSSQQFELSRGIEAQKVTIEAKNRYTWLKDPDFNTGEDVVNPQQLWTGKNILAQTNPFPDGAIPQAMLDYRDVDGDEWTDDNGRKLSEFISGNVMHCREVPRDGQEAYSYIPPLLSDSRTDGGCKQIAITITEPITSKTDIKIKFNHMVIFNEVGNVGAGVHYREGTRWANFGLKIGNKKVNKSNIENGFVIDDDIVGLPSWREDRDMTGDTNNRPTGATPFSRGWAWGYHPERPRGGEVHTYFNVEPWAGEIEFTISGEDLVNKGYVTPNETDVEILLNFGWLVADWSRIDEIGSGATDDVPTLSSGFYVDDLKVQLDVRGDDEYIYDGGVVDSEWKNSGDDIDIKIGSQSSLNHTSNLYRKDGDNFTKILSFKEASETTPIAMEFGESLLRSYFNQHADTTVMLSGTVKGTKLPSLSYNFTEPFLNGRIFRPYKYIYDVVECETEYEMIEHKNNFLDYEV